MLPAELYEVVQLLAAAIVQVPAWIAAITLMSGLVGIDHVMIKKEEFLCLRRVPPADEGQLADDCAKAGYAQADHLDGCLFLWSCLASHP